MLSPPLLMGKTRYSMNYKISRKCSAHLGPTGSSIWAKQLLYANYH